MAPDKLLAEWFWIDRWVGSSAFGLPQEARGVYREMLTQAWRRGAQLPNDPDQIRRMTATTAGEWRRAWPKVKKFWRIDGDTLVNDTQVEIYAEAKARSERASKRGLSGAQARHKHSNGNAQAEPEHKPPVSVSGLRSPEETEKESLSLAFPKKPMRRGATYLAPPPLDVIADRAGRLLERYAELFYEHRHGAKYHAQPAIDFPNACALVTTWTDDVRLEKLMVLVLTTDDDAWIMQSDRGFGVFVKKATWADDRLRTWEAEHGMVAR